MDLFDTIDSRRSVKHYDANASLPETDFQRIMEAAIKAPTSFNIQHWRFVRVRDGALRQQIRAAAWNQAQVTDASELLVIVGDARAWARQPERYWRHADAATRDALVPMLQDFYRDRDWLQRDEAIRSGAMAAQNIMLSAKALGYDSNPMIGFDIDEVGRLLKLPEDHVIVMMLAIGTATSPAWPRSGQLALDELVVADHF
ncbi:MAG: nitroreductase family protein [Rhodocyclaceae bacterium]|nr:nitroreductase family protein [Rhodocyclaceae bacterium]